jgi:2'-5' RNA ligase
MIRTFIAIDLPTRVQQTIEKFEKDLQKVQAAVSWIKVDRIHLTLKFLGDVASEQIAGIQLVLVQTAASTKPFQLQPAGCGAFPSLKQMRVVWVGIRGDDTQLKNLQQQVESALAPLGFKPEDRPFRAHLTLGRVRGKQNIRSLQEALLANENFEAEAFDVGELVLYKSELRPEGARYTPLFRASFTGLPD